MKKEELDKIKKMLPTKSWCPQLLTGISVQKHGLRPCCEFAEDPVPVNNPTDYKNSRKYKKWIETMERGEWLPACWICKKKEEEGAISQRLSEVKNQLTFRFEDAENVDLFYEVWKKNEFLWINFQPTSLCNQACIMCNAHDSSKIRDEVKKNPWAHWHKHPLKPDSVPQPDLSVYKLHELGRMYLSGGEPSIMKNVMKYIGSLTETDRYVQVDMNTNFNNFNSLFWETMSGVDNLGVLGSIDAIGERAEYIRYGCKWEEVKSNVNRFKEILPNANFRLQPAWGIYNIFYIDEYINWAVEMDLEIFWHGGVYTPHELSVTYLHPSFKSILLDKIENSRYKELKNLDLDSLDHVSNMIKNATFDSKIFKMTKSHFEINDKLRNLDYRKTFPEFANYIDNVESLYISTNRV